MPRPDWKHCPRCGEPLTFGPRRDEARDVMHCTSCGLVIYENPAPTASGLVLRDGRLMLTRRARPPQQGMWDVPGGFIDPLEHPEDALRRELFEETGLTVELGDLLGIWCDVYGEGGEATLNLFYLAVVTGGDESPADDVTEIGWFALDALPPMAEIAFENGRLAIAALIERSTSR